MRTASETLDLEGLLQFCETHDQETKVHAVISAGSIRAAARELGVQYNSVYGTIYMLRSKAALKGYAPSYGMTRTVPDGFSVKGVSSYYDKEGALKGQWVKSKADEARQAEIMREIIAGYCNELPAFPAIKRPDACDGALHNVYTVTDAHVGMLSWRGEGGEDWDLTIAAKTLSGCFRAMIDAAPKAASCTIAQLGDFLHYDGIVPVTPTSGYVLDADSRFQKMVSVAVDLLCGMIDAALVAHERVDILLAEGNHDIASSVWLQTMFKRMYRDNSRVTFIGGALPFYAQQHGKVMLGWHHGHLKTPKDLPLTLAAEFSEMWGKTKYRYAHMGDKHHTDEKEHNGIIVLQHPTLAARDAYASRHGWHALRRAMAISYHKDHGEWSRHIVNPGMLS
jgi:hypothetical protein